MVHYRRFITVQVLCSLPLRFLRHGYALQQVAGKQMYPTDMLTRSLPEGELHQARATDGREVHAVDLQGYMVTKISERN